MTCNKLFLLYLELKEYSFVSVVKILFICLLVSMNHCHLISDQAKTVVFLLFSLLLISCTFQCIIALGFRGLFATEDFFLSSIQVSSLSVFFLYCSSFSTKLSEFFTIFDTLFLAIARRLSMEIIRENFTYSLSQDFTNQDIAGPSKILLVELRQFIF